MQNSTSSIKPIPRPEENDVLSGRGRFAIEWQGNINLQKLIQKRKLEFIHGNVQTQRRVSEEIVKEIYSSSPPGRFLKLNENGKLQTSYVY